MFSYGPLDDINIKKCLQTEPDDWNWQTTKDIRFSVGPITALYQNTQYDMTIFYFFTLHNTPA